MRPAGEQTVSHFWGGFWRYLEGECCPFAFAERDWLRSRHGMRWKIWDFMVGVFAFLMGFVASPYTVQMPAPYYMAIVGGLHGVLLLCCSRLCGVPAPEKRSTSYELVSHAVVATTLAYFVFSTIVWFVLMRVYGRYIVFTMEAIVLSGLIVPRWLIRKYLSVNPLKLLVYGAGDTGKKFCERVAACPEFDVVGVLDQNPKRHGEALNGHRILGSIQDFDDEKLGQIGVDVVVICVGHALSHNNASRLLRLPLKGIEVLNKGAFVETHFHEISVEYKNPHWFVSSPSVPRNPSLFAAKRITNLGIGAIVLLLSLPLWALVALVIKLDGKGPVFYRQKRVGWGGKTFELIKFRTMRMDAEKDGAQWATKKDPRVTRIGRFLRVTRLDELPQLWNVVKGEMALVGPRPERPEFVEQLVEKIPFYEQRHLVPPGLTGWAQIKYPYGASVADARNKLQYDLYYVRHMSLAFDFEIMFRTIPLVMKGSR